MRRNASYSMHSKPNKFAYAVVVYLIYRKKILNSSDNITTTDEMSNATNIGSYQRNSDTRCDDPDDSDSYVPRSLAALAERDSLREREYQQKIATTSSSNGSQSHSNGDQERHNKRSSGSNADRSSQISSAMIVGESVSQPMQRKIAHNTFDVVDSVNVNGCQIIALNSDENGCNSGAISDYSENRQTAAATAAATTTTTTTAAITTNKMNKNKGVANVLGPREYVLTPMVDKKPRSGGFLSRFAGFRFSLRGNKKKQKIVDIHEPQVSNDNVVMVTKANAPATTSPPPRPSTTSRGRNESSGTGSGGYQRNSMRSNEFVYIPLRDPIVDKTITSPSAANNNNWNNTNATASTNQVHSVAPITSTPIQSPQSKSSVVNSVERKHVLTAKPPLPRLPPRVIGVCAKQQPGTPSSPSPSSPAAATAGAARTATIPVNGRGILTTFAQGPAQRANSAPREINASDMRHYRMATADDNDDNFYQQFRLDRRMKQSGCGIGGYANYASEPNDGAVLRADPNDASFNHKHHDVFNESTHEGNLTIAGDGDYKIGLIETNLDTHETVISGKTRSLMELGPQQMSLHGRGAQSAATRRTVGATPNKVGSIVEPRRPHKSMEFLLDKENQKLVLVSSV